MSASPQPPPVLWPLLTHSLSFLYLLFPLHSQVNLVRENWELHIVLIWGLNEVGSVRRKLFQIFGLPLWSLEVICERPVLAELRSANGISRAGFHFCGCTAVLQEAGET